MEFEWDENKNQINRSKHDVDFSDAKHVFKDINRTNSEDTRNDYGEKRWITIGMVSNAILTVVYTIRNVIRIISARRSNKKERQEYYDKSQNKNGNKKNSL